MTTGPDNYDQLLERYERDPETELELAAIWRGMLMMVAAVLVIVLYLHDGPQTRCDTSQTPASFSRLPLR